MKVLIIVETTIFQILFNNYFKNRHRYIQNMLETANTLHLISQILKSHSVVSNFVSAVLSSSLMYF